MDFGAISAGLQPELRPLTIFSNGLGRDSMTIQALAEWGHLMIDGVPTPLAALDAVAFSDPGHEWPLTYKAAEVVAQSCSAAGVPFFYLRKPGAPLVRKYAQTIYPELWEEAKTRARRRGHKDPEAAAVRHRRRDAPWRQGPWRSLQHKAASGGYHVRLPLLDEVKLRGRTTTRASAECTVSQKIEPIRELLDDLCQQRYGMTLAQWGERVKAGELQPHRMIVGIAADESERERPWDPRKTGLWGVRDVFPLVRMGITKEAESQILAAAGWGWCHKSGCMGCHYQPVALFWVVREQYPDVFAEIVAVERHSNQVRRRRGKTLLFIKGSEPIEDLVRNWGRSPRVLKAQFNRGALDEAFMRKLTQVDPGYRRVGGSWAGSAKIGPDHLPKKLQAELAELLLSKGYDRNCGFGD